MVKPILLASATEIAYLQQCVELKRQLNEIEELNKTFHLRKSTLSHDSLSKAATPASLLQDTPGTQCSDLNAAPDNLDESFIVNQPKLAQSVEEPFVSPTASGKKRNRRRRAKASQSISVAETPTNVSNVVEDSTTPKVIANGPLTSHAITAMEPIGGGVAKRPNATCIEKSTTSLNADVGNPRSPKVYTEDEEAILQRETQLLFLIKYHAIKEAGMEVDWDRLAELMGNRRTALDIQEHVCAIEKSFEKRGDWVSGKLDKWLVRGKGAARRKERDVLEVRSEE